jgi:hypothetical protein
VTHLPHLKDIRMPAELGDLLRHVARRLPLRW